jgi:hypothetical protein
MAKASQPAGGDTYKVLIGLNYPTAKGEMRAEIGDSVPDPKKGLLPLPDVSIPALLDRGAIVRVKTPAAADSKTADATGTPAATETSEG